MLYNSGFLVLLDCKVYAMYLLSILILFSSLTHSCANELSVFLELPKTSKSAILARWLLGYHDIFMDNILDYLLKIIHFYKKKKKIKPKLSNFTFPSSKIIIFG